MKSLMKSLMKGRLIEFGCVDLSGYFGQQIVCS